VAYATDALQVHGWQSRAGLPEPGLTQGLPATRLSTSTRWLCCRTRPANSHPAKSADLGWFGSLQVDHRHATVAGRPVFVDADARLA